MSWVRWGNDSELYIFETVSGKIQCCGCPFDWPRSFEASSLEEIVSHILEHTAAGHRVPKDLINSITRGENER